MIKPKIVFVDEQDNVIGAGTREEAVEQGYIHRIVRIFLVNSKGEILIHQRAPQVSLGRKWDHGAAGHVDEGEEYIDAAYRELAEEAGVKGIMLMQVVRYYGEGTSQPKPKKCFNTVFTGSYDGPLVPNEEVSEFKWIDPKDLFAWIEKSPDDFTVGFVTAFKKFLELSKKT